MSKPTRKDKVLTVLTAAKAAGGYEGQFGRWTWTDGWVDGHDLCGPTVGGSEGLRRLRDLRAEGVEIEKRNHPTKGRATVQYRLSERP